VATTGIENVALLPFEVTRVQPPFVVDSCTRIVNAINTYQHHRGR